MGETTVRRVGVDGDVVRFTWPNQARGGPRPKTGHYVYYLYDVVTGDLLYVGCTNNIKRRLNEHHATKRYRREDTRCEVERYDRRITALIRERRMIREMNPRDNEREVR